MHQTLLATASFSPSHRLRNRRVRNRIVPQLPSQSLSHRIVPLSQSPLASPRVPSAAPAKPKADAMDFNTFGFAPVRRRNRIAPQSPGIASAFGIASAAVLEGTQVQQKGSRISRDIRDPSHFNQATNYCSSFKGCRPLVIQSLQMSRGTPISFEVPSSA